MDLLASVMPNEFPYQQEHAGERNSHTRRMGRTRRDNKITRVKKTTRTNAGPDLKRHRDDHTHGKRAPGDGTRVACPETHVRKRMSGNMRRMLETCVACLKHASHVWRRMSGNMRFKEQGGPREHQPIRDSGTQGVAAVDQSEGNLGD